MSIDKRTDEQKEIDKIVLERVKQGIQRLERMHGPNWVEKFGGMEDFNIKDGSCCVLGKVYGDYEDGLHELWPKQEGDVLYWGNTEEQNENSVEYGFNVHSDSDYEWDSLQKTWVKQLTKLGVK